MRSEKISYKKAMSFLEKIEGFPISKVVCHPDGSIKLLIGKQFKIEKITLDTQADLEQYLKKELFLSEFEIRISKCAQILDAKTKQPLFPGIVADILLGHMIERILISQERELKLCVGEMVLIILPCLSCKESWRISQPGTEADILIMKEELYRYFLSSKRWSANHPMCRDLWHPFPLTGSDVWCENESLVCSVVNNLAGTTIVHMFKSKDMNFYNIGFCTSSEGELREFTELHITCSLCLSAEKNENQFWGDSSKEDFEDKSAQFLKQTVKKIYLLKNNVLRIVCNVGYIDITPADDGHESWRLILPSGLNIAAGNSWVGV